MLKKKNVFMNPEDLAHLSDFFYVIFSLLRHANRSLFYDSFLFFFLRLNNRMIHPHRLS